MNDLTQGVLKKYIHYEPLTGVFTWIKTVNGAVSLGSVAGGISNQGYRRIMFMGRKYNAARLAFLYMTGSWPDEADHINRIRDDDRWCNLRNCSRSGNNMNRNQIKNTKSGFTGVSKHSGTGNWLVSIRTKAGRLHLGTYVDLELAALVASEARAKYHGEFAV